MKNSTLRIIFRTILVYVIFGFAWILLSDRLLFVLVKDPATRLILETVKGWLYVLVTALLLYGLLHSQLSAQERNEQALAHTRLELEEVQKQFQVTFEQAAVGIIHMGMDNHIIRANRRFCEMLGYTPEEIHQRSVFDLIAKEDRDEGYRKRKMVLDGEIETYSREIRMISKSGDLRWFSVTISLARHTDNQPWYWIGIYNDISQMKSIEEKLLTLNNELEQRVNQRTEQLRLKNLDLEEFSFSISHDLRAPLRAMTGYSRILLDEYNTNLDENGQRMLGYVITASQRMNQMIEDLLNYSRLGRQSIVMQKINVKQAITTALSDLSAQIQESHAAILTPSIDDHLEFWGDPTLIQQILSNLIGNAIVYTRPDTNPEIEIEIEPQEKWIYLRIKDHGIGIEEKYFGKIFNIFQRLHTEEEYPGSGIGLALVKKAVERLDGDITVESTVDRGSSFCVKLHRPPAEE
jgi:PAS domain S-box-containing protein